MSKFIRKIFIKDYEDVNNPIVRKKHGFLAAFGGIIINLLLFVIKLVIGLLTFSLSIVYDAVNNLTDLFSCIFTLVGFKVAALPADKRHPYGHERVEYVTGMVISFIIIAVAIILGYNSIHSLIHLEDSPRYDVIAFIILGISIIFKILLGLFYKGIGKAIDSESIKASKQDSFNDAICTTGVLIVAIINYFVDGLNFLDPTISLLIAIFIFYSGIRSAIETASPLIGTSLDKNIIDNIKNDVLIYDGVLGVHDITCHTYGHTKAFVTLHAEVDGYQNVLKIHEIIDTIETDLDKKYGIELTIHMDPVDTKNKLLPELKKRIKLLLKEIDDKLTMHDLQIVNEDDKVHIIFDIVKDKDLHLKDEELLNLVKEKIEALNKSYLVSIKIDHDFE